VTAASASFGRLIRRSGSVEPDRRQDADARGHHRCGEIPQELAASAANRLGSRLSQVRRQERRSSPSSRCRRRSPSFSCRCRSPSSSCRRRHARKQQSHRCGQAQHASSSSLACRSRQPPGRHSQRCGKGQHESSSALCHRSDSTGHRSSEFGTSAANEPGPRFDLPRRQKRSQHGPAEESSSSFLCRWTSPTRCEPDCIHGPSQAKPDCIPCRLQAVRPATAHEQEDEADAGKNDEAPADVSGAPVRVLLAPAAGSDAGKRWMLAGPGCVTHTPCSKPASELTMRDKGTAPPDDSLCPRVGRPRKKSMGLKGRDSDNHRGREQQGHHSELHPSTKSVPLKAKISKGKVRSRLTPRSRWHAESGTSRCGSKRAGSLAVVTARARTYPQIRLSSRFAGMPAAPGVGSYRPVMPRSLARRLRAMRTVSFRK
jgi:hypothetical protein